MEANDLSLMRGNLKVNFMQLNRFPSEIVKKYTKIAISANLIGH